MRTRFFDKTQNIKSLKDKFNYIKNHNYYYTMNSWNQLRSISNNVKIYNLGLTPTQKDKFFQIYTDESLSNDLYQNLGNIIDDFNEENNCRTYFNGSSGGYLVIIPKNNNGNIIDDSIADYTSKKEMIDDMKDDYISYRDCLSDVKYIINKNFDIVKNFDRLCDVLRDELIYILDNAIINEHEEEETIIKKYKTLDFAEM